MCSSSGKGDLLSLFHLKFYKKRSSWILAPQMVPEHPYRPEKQTNKNDSKARPSNKNPPSKVVKDDWNLGSSFEVDPAKDVLIAPHEPTCSRYDVQTTLQEGTGVHRTKGGRKNKRNKVPKMVELEFDWAAEIAGRSFDHVNEPPSWMRDYRKMEDLAESVENCAQLFDFIEDDDDDWEAKSERYDEFALCAHGAPNASEELGVEAPAGCSWCPTAINSDTIANLTGKELSVRVHLYARTLAALLREAAFRTHTKMNEDKKMKTRAQFPAYPVGRGRGRLHRDTS